MTLNNEGLPTRSRPEFCLALKTARERKGITLARIAEVTKIPEYLFAALERNDLRRWPKGLFRRSFFRDYARTIGLPVAETSAEFVLLFPDDEAAVATATEVPPETRRGLIIDVLTRISNAFGSAGGDAPPQPEEPEQRIWISDARRVGPAPRLRVRIKVPR